MIDNIIYQALNTTAALVDLYGGRVYQRGSLGVNGNPADPEHPYVMYGDDADTPHPTVQETARGAADRVMRVYVYDDPGSYVRIKQIHAAIRETLLGLVGTTDEDGSRLTGIAWRGAGADAYDRVRRCNVKVATYRLTARF